MIETESIINSRPLTVDALSDVNSEKPISPLNLLQENVQDQTCIPDEDGGECSIWLMSFGNDGGKNFWPPYKIDKNGQR